MPEFPITAHICTIRHKMQIYIIFRPIPYHSQAGNRTVPAYMRSGNREPRADAYRRAPFSVPTTSFNPVGTAEGPFQYRIMLQSNSSQIFITIPVCKEKSDHQHYPPFGLGECIRITHYYCIDLGRGHRIAVLPDMKFPAVYNLCNLFCPESSVSFDKNIKYSFFYFHFNASS